MVRLQRAGDFQSLLCTKVRSRLFCVKNMIFEDKIICVSENE